MSNAIPHHITFQIRVLKTQHAAPEVTGTFDLSFAANTRRNFTTVQNIPRNASAAEMKSLLENVDGIDNVQVTHWGWCYG